MPCSEYAQQLRILRQPIQPQICLLHFHGGHILELPGNYPFFTKYGNLPLCVENYALFSLPLISTKHLYTYTLSNILYLREPSGNII